MKERFIEQDGLLFLKCEPEPLETDSKMPCLAQPIQDNSRMGILNKEARHVFPLNNNIVISSLRGDYVMTPDAHAHAHARYARFEVVGKHCPEGSREWALWQMLNGKKVKHKRDATNYYYMDKNGMLVSKGEQIIEDESRWLKTSSRNGWQIYEEPKPEPQKKR